MRDGSVIMGAKCAHSDKSVKLDTHVHWTLLFDKIKLPLNPIWPPLDIRIGHTSVNAWLIFIILVSIIRFSMADSPSVRYFVTISKVLTTLHRI